MLEIRGARIPFLFFFALLLLSAPACRAEDQPQAKFYTDSNGTVHLVDGSSKVPEKYRNTARDVSETKPLNRVRSFEGGKALTMDSANVMYMTSWCPQCKAAEKYLGSKNVRYQAIDIEKDRSGLAAFRELGGRGVPLLKIRGKLLHGFNSRAIDEILRNQD